ncbi:MAG: RNA polymerase sigma factor [Sandaracinaceae bacterium]
MSNVIAFPTPRPVSDVNPDLVRAIAAAVSQAITEVYRAHARSVRAYARRMLQDDVAAEDVVHDAFVALPAAMARFRGECPVESFLLSIAVNLCRRRIRSRVRGQRAKENLQRREVPTPPATPESETRQRELAEVLKRGLDTLSVDHREVFVLCAVEERTSPEVASILDVPEATVRTRLFYARRQLRAFLEGAGVR